MVINKKYFDFINSALDNKSTKKGLSIKLKPLNNLFN